MIIKNMYTLCNYRNYLLAHFPSKSSHFFSVFSVTFNSSSSYLLAAYSSKSLVLYTTYLLSPTCLFAVLVSFYKTLISPVSSDPFTVHLSSSLPLHVPLHCLSFLLLFTSPCTSQVLPPKLVTIRWFFYSLLFSCCLLLSSLLHKTPVPSVCPGCCGWK